MTTSTKTTSYTVWAEGAKRDQDKYTGTDLDAAERAYNKAVADRKWRGVYIEVDNGVTRYTPQQLREGL
jgi:hypothetical protein